MPKEPHDRFQPTCKRTRIRATQAKLTSKEMRPLLAFLHAGRNAAPASEGVVFVAKTTRERQ